MLRIHSTVGLQEIEPVLRAAAQRHGSTLMLASHLGQGQGGAAGGRNEAFVFTLGQIRLYSTLLEADVGFAGYLPCRVAAWREGSGTVLQSLTPAEWCRLLDRADLAPLAERLELELRGILEDASRPLTATARSRPEAEFSTMGATEEQVNMRGALAQRIDRRGTKLEDEAGTGTHDAPGG